MCFNAFHSFPLFLFSSLFSIARFLALVARRFSFRFAMVKKAQRLRDKAARRLGIGVPAGFAEQQRQRQQQQPSPASASAAAATSTSKNDAAPPLAPSAPRHVVEKVVKKLRFLKRAAASAPLVQKHEQKGSRLGVERKKGGGGGVSKKSSSAKTNQRRRRRSGSSSSAALGDFSSLVASLSDPAAFAPKKAVALASLSSGKERMRAAEVARKGAFFSTKGRPEGFDPFAAVAAAVASSVGGGAGGNGGAGNGAPASSSAPSASGASRWQGMDPAKVEQQRKRMRREAKERRKAAARAGAKTMMTE